jgi:7-cyano-7-deazaguanine synthase in queuosine biosynthesis
MGEQWIFTIWTEKVGHGYFCVRIQGRKGDKISFGTHKTNYTSLQNRKTVVNESFHAIKLIKNTGVCWVCGETNPQVIVSHHLYGRKTKNTLKNDLVCGLCANCHERHRGVNKDGHILSILNAIERGGING